MCDLPIFCKLYKKFYKEWDLPVDHILQQRNKYQHVINQMRIDQGNEFCTPGLGPSDNVNYIFNDNAGTINFKNIQVLRSSLQNAIKACFIILLDIKTYKVYCILIESSIFF